jgi:RNA polymerase sigma-70 factor (ECF subfamily)
MMNNLSELTIQRAASGDMTAFEDVYKKTSGFVYNVALRITRSTHDAEEVAQMIYIKLLKNLRKYRHGASFKSWLYRVTFNEALNFVKKKKHGLQKEKNHSENIRIFDTPDIDRKMDSAFTQTLLDKSLGRLSPDYRVCIIMREINGLSYQEIADALAIKINTVRTRIKRGREQLIAIGKKIKKEMENEMQKSLGIIAD